MVLNRPRRFARIAVSAAALVGLLGAGMATPESASAAEPAAVHVGAALTTSGLSAVDARIKKLVAKRANVPQLGHDLAIRIMDPSTGALIYSSQSLEGQMAASNTKLVNAFVALKTMGPQARANTTAVVQRSGTRVVLVGDGDPMLTNSRLNILAARTVQGLAKASATGKAPASISVAYHDSLFPGHKNAVGWASHYVPSEVNPVSALQRYGQHTRYPSRDAATYFASRLKAHGVKATLIGRTTSKAGPVVGTVAGATVQASVKQMLLISDNNIAEVLARRSSLAAGNGSSWYGWQRTAYTIMRRAGIPMSKVKLADGSGLSRSTRLTAKSLAWTLTKATTSKDPNLAGFRSLMAVAGRSGTLAKSYGRYDTSPSKCATGRVFAKTGHIAGVYALSGIAIARDGRPRAFSFVANGVSGYRGLDVRRALDRLAATVVGCY